MSKLRPECADAQSWQHAIPRDTALFLIRDAVARRRTLIYGRLHDGKGHHCALGAFWTDNPNAVLYDDLLDEVAAVNDSLPETASPQQRWRKVMGWLRWKIKVLAAKETTP